ncbi:MAG: cellulase family glycosylhydrolase [Ruminococcus sp.]|uniref:cellulase family glycosylhydrolase n=1 Tax=Ruminococcus sp. TaxID=41978 RepID=UPI0025E9E75F|nr:cellulase family glycosylhydrolase [Ruminococcus sp.]MBO4865129.1 cellulase family glycosylhydrolase [Ruminococcus sp.]
MKSLIRRMAAFASIAALTVSGAASGISAVRTTTASAATVADDCNDDWLHAKGSRLYDKYGNEVWLTGANWFGFNCSEACPHYLWSADADDCLKEIADRGINVIRFPVSSELLVSWMNGKPMAVSSFSCNTDPAYTINADFCEADGKTAKNSMEVFDIMMQKCKKYGIKAFIDVHSPHTDNSGHNYNLWYGKAGVTTKVWIDSLVWLADKYKNDDTLIAYDLKNEPHGKGQEGADAAKWDGSTDENNWAYAATKCAEAILDVNPNALILVEGVEQSMSGAMAGDYWGMPDRRDNSPYIGAWWGGNFRGAREYPIVPKQGTSQIVYSPHDYGPSVYAQTWFDKNFTEQTLLDDYWYDTWAYINAEEIGPELIGEWGGHMDGKENQKWMTLLRDYMIKHHINHTFWCLNTNSGDTGGLWDGLGFMAGSGTTIKWNEPKYELFEKALWQTSTTGKYIGLDHKVALGKNGISLGEFYSKYSNTEGSNLDGGKKAPGNGGNNNDTPVVQTIKISSTAGEGSVKLSWNSISNADKYAVYQNVNGSWKQVTETTGTSYNWTGLTSGTNYKVAVVARVNGTWTNDYSNAITVTPKSSTSSDDYPKNVKANYSTQYHQVQFIWDKVEGADKYGIAVYLAGKWRIQTSNITTNSYLTPKNLTPGMTYKVAIAARVNGKWNTTDPIKNAITVTIK